MKIREARVSHMAMVEFDPRPFAGGYIQGIKRATALRVRWEWDENGWNPYSVTVFFHRVKKDGGLYADGSDAILSGSNRADFEDAIEFSRPTYDAVLLSPDSGSSDA